MQVAEEGDVQVALSRRVEDPVRVLRVARFAARFHHLGFRIAEETAGLIREIGESGELETLVAERVWSELSRALDEKDPSVFFTSLRDCGVLVRLFPEIDALFEVHMRPTGRRDRPIPVPVGLDIFRADDDRFSRL